MVQDNLKSNPRIIWYYLAASRARSTGTRPLLVMCLLVAGAGTSGASRSHYDPDEVVLLTAAEQAELLHNAQIECLKRIVYDPYPDTSDGQLYCNRTWDGIMCWPDTSADTVATQPCANYINKFKPSARATRTCTADGTWFFHTGKNKTWTNYQPCVGREKNFSDFIGGHVRSINLMSTIGYGMSFVSLVTAIGIMIYFKKLHCSRNYIHTNLFLSFVIRALLAFLKDNLLVEGVGLPIDVIQNQHGVMFRKEGTHWQCKLLFSLFQYALGANYMWILVEGMYLHMLIFVSVFSERSRVWGYIAFGWISPLAFVIPWVIVRATVENRICWNIHHTRAYFWIIKGPIAASNLVNFIFFLNIVRVLFTKLRASNSPEARKYRKLAKSTLVLIPLFGVHYIIFIGFQEEQGNYVELAKLYFEMFFNSFQGFIVAMLFCFCNGEVQSEIKKKWQRYQLQRGSSGRRSTRGWHTVTSYVSRARNSPYSPQSTNMNRGELSCAGNGHCLRSSGRLQKALNNENTDIKCNNNVKIVVTCAVTSTCKTGPDSQSGVVPFENRKLATLIENTDSSVDEMRPGDTECNHLIVSTEDSQNITTL